MTEVAETPIWWDDGAPGTRFPGGELRVDVAVVGGGFTGLSTALHVLRRQPGARVVVLEAETLGFGASGRTTGMLGPGVGQSVVALRRRLGPARARATYEATLQAVRDVMALVDSEAMDCELEAGGQLIVARAPAERTRLARSAEVLAELEAPFEALDDAALGGTLRMTTRRQGTAPGPAALRLPVAGTLHPLKLVRELAARVVARGGAVYEGARVLAIAEETGATRLQLAGGRVTADRVVLATAGYTTGLEHLRGRVLPVRLQALATAPLAADQRAAIGWRGREGILDGRRLFAYARLTADDRIVFGGGVPRYRGDEVAPSAWARSDRAAQAALVRELHATFAVPRPLVVARAWSGTIAYTVDAMPSVGLTPGYTRTWHATGWCGHGVALATAAGAWLAELCMGGAPGADLPWSRPAPPWVPTGLARWVGFHATIAAMAARDRWA